MHAFDSAFNNLESGGNVLNAINVERTFFWPLHQKKSLQSTQNLGVSVTNNQKKSG
jgi:hypothetical protein